MIKTFLDAHTVADPDGSVPFPTLYRAFKMTPQTEGICKLVFLNGLISAGIKFKQVRRNHYVVEGLQLQ